MTLQAGQQITGAICFFYMALLSSAPRASPTRKSYHHPLHRHRNRHHQLPLDCQGLQAPPIAHDPRSSHVRMLPYLLLRRPLRSLRRRSYVHAGRGHRPHRSLLPVHCRLRDNGGPPSSGRSWANWTWRATAAAVYGTRQYFSRRLLLCVALRRLPLHG